MKQQRRGRIGRSAQRRVDGFAQLLTRHALREVDEVFADRRPVHAKQPARGVVDRLDVVASVDHDHADRHAQHEVFDAFALLAAALGFAPRAWQLDGRRAALAAGAAATAAADP